MDILEILNNSKEQLYLNDLLFFETELATGDYEESYIVKCKEQIEILKKWLNDKDNIDTSKKQIDDDPKKDNNQVIMSFNELIPKTSNSNEENKSKENIILSDIKLMRENNDYKSIFKNYVQNNDELNSIFIDKHYTFFLPWEIDLIISIKQMSEEFLEKYFNSLNKDNISRYQCFSESFFMKHYSQLDVKVVLTKGKNKWQKKENRSKQLDVFLRLKGVKL